MLPRLQRYHRTLTWLPRLCTQDGLTALQHATIQGFADVVSFLLECKADPNVRMGGSANRYSCLLTTPSMHLQHPDSIYVSMNCLHVAAKKGRVDVLKCFVAEVFVLFQARIGVSSPCSAGL